MAEKKGIRVNALAKELGIESKIILRKLKEEGLGDAAPNHQSTIALGLAETVREWFNSGQLAAPEASAVAVAEKPKKTSRSKKKADAPAEEPPSAPAKDVVSTAVAEVEQRFQKFVGSSMCCDALYDGPLWRIARIVLNRSAGR